MKLLDYVLCIGARFQNFNLCVDGIGGAERQFAERPQFAFAVLDMKKRIGFINRLHEERVKGDACENN